LNPGGAIRVLLVDLDTDTREMYREYLRRSALELDEASDGREALAKALSQPRDVIVTETRLPGIDGYELCQLLRRDLATKTTPIIVVTGESVPHNLERVRKAGADAVLVKPCLPDALLTEIRRATQRSQELRQQSQVLRTRLQAQVTRARDASAHSVGGKRRTLSRAFTRQETTTPPSPPPHLLCPVCDQGLAYRRSHIGGVSELHREQWDYLECVKGCGVFQYRQRTGKLRRVF